MFPPRLCSIEDHKKAARSHARGIMLEVVEAQGRRFRLRREPMVKVKQVDLPILALTLSGTLLVISRQLMLSTQKCQCCRRQT